MKNSESTREVLLLIAELAQATSEWRGGVFDGAAYTHARWRESLKKVSDKANLLAAQPIDAEQG